MSPALFRRSAAPTSCSCIPNSTFCIAVMCGKSEYAWKTMPISRLLAGTLVTSSPAMTTRATTDERESHEQPECEEKRGYGDRDRDACVGPGERHDLNL